MSLLHPHHPHQSLLVAGRLNYDGINCAVTELNKTLEEKYTFLGRGFQAMASIKDKKRYKELRSQETRELRGVQFVVAEDLRACPALKTENSRKSIFTILRHCQRIKEIRKPGAPIKYAVVSKAY